MCKPCSPPLPKPPEITDEQVRRGHALTKDAWRESKDLFCRDCSGPAFYSPYSDRVIGCTNCSMWFDLDKLNVKLEEHFYKDGE